VSGRLTPSVAPLCCQLNRAAVAYSAAWKIYWQLSDIDQVVDRSSSDPIFSREAGDLTPTLSKIMGCTVRLLRKCTGKGRSI
jgi:hypothetical protein